MTCTHCQGCGFLNVEQIPEELHGEDVEKILAWVKEHYAETDAAVCDCCGDGENWYGIPGEHYVTNDDQPGPSGPYAYNGGRCECD